MKNLAILEEGFISPLLIETLKTKQIPLIIQNENNSNEVKEKITISKKFYTNSEKSLTFLMETELKNSIRMFKDKGLMRNFFKKANPTLFFKEGTKEEIMESKLDVKKTYIIKPSIGFLSVGIKKVKNKKELKEKLNLIELEIDSYSTIFDETILNKNKFLLEEYISGEELACDAYFNSEGELIILGIFKHPFLNEEDFRDVVYYTNKEIILEMEPKIGNFLKKAFEKEEVKNFPIHFEFRLENNEIKPIEINPLRFGGYGLTDLSFYAFGINPYEFYFDNKKPDWDKILIDKNETFFFVLAGIKKSLKEELKPNHEKLKATFKKLIKYYPMKYKKHLAMGCAFAKTIDLKEALKYLKINFKEFT